MIHCEIRIQVRCDANDCLNSIYLDVDVEEITDESLTFDPFEICDVLADKRWSYTLPTADCISYRHYCPKHSTKGES